MVEVGAMRVLEEVAEPWRLCSKKRKKKRGKESNKIR
jgi:hypothetical protein